MEQRLPNFPVTTFAIVMGTTGLTALTGKFHHNEWLPELLNTVMLFVTLGLFALILGSYLLKALLYFKEVKAEFRHPIRINFFSAISISFLLQAVAFMEFWPGLSAAFWWIGMLLHTLLMFHTISFWISHNFEIQFMNPAWFIPVVGNIIVPIAGVRYMPMEFNYFYFSVGFFFWIILFTIFLNRVVFHQQLPQKFMPTLFILIAPPAVGFLSYLRLGGEMDFFALFLLTLSYFFLILLLFLWKKFRKLKFFISWWAFTFPLDAITLTSATAWERTGYPLFKYLSFGLLCITVIVIGLVTWLTLRLISRGQLCIKEE